MTRNLLSFYVTKTDLESLLRSIESKRRLQIVISGLFDSPHIYLMQSLVNIPNLGYIAAGDINQTIAYLVANHEISIKVRPVLQRRGNIKYAVDQLDNPQTIVFKPGGSFDEKCLIAGQVGTTSDDPNSLELFQWFCKEIRDQCTKIKSFYVGKEAGVLLDQGWRLTANTKMPTCYDLKRDCV